MPLGWEAVRVYSCCEKISGLKRKQGQSACELTEQEGKTMKLKCTDSHRNVLGGIRITSICRYAFWVGGSKEVNQIINSHDSVVLDGWRREEEVEKAFCQLYVHWFFLSNDHVLILITHSLINLFVCSIFLCSWCMQFMCRGQRITVFFFSSTMGAPRFELRSSGLAAGTFFFPAELPRWSNVCSF